jgi:hypothetical protein
MKKTIFGFALLAMASANLIKADVITTLVSSSAGTLTYEVDLASEQMGTSGSYFGTTYCFYFGSSPVAITSTTGLLSTAFAFSVTSSLTRAASAPPALGQGPNDASGLVGSGIYDIRYTYNDSALIGSFAAGSTLVLGTFTVKSSSSSTGISEYDGQANAALGLGGNSHPVLVATAAIPEPMSMGLFGGGLAILGLLRSRRK